MDNEAGHKRKEFSSKSKSAIKKFWFNWFGDIHPFKPISRFFTSIITFIKRSMGKFILFSVLLFGGIIGLIFSELIIEKYKTFSYYRNIQYLRDSAIELNKNCPQQINDFTIATSVEFTKLEHFYRGSYRDRAYIDSTYGLTYNYKHNKLIGREEYRILKKDVFRSFCSDELYKFYRKNNFHMEYNYEYRTLKRGFKVRKLDCQKPFRWEYSDTSYDPSYYEVKNGESLEDIIQKLQITKQQVGKIDSVWIPSPPFPIKDGDILSIQPINAYN